ncbi:iron(III) transport system ATP-binding protein [Clostridium tetanomorphum]|uniref:ABC transporter ATP-binding protein n=1 Tax=Clostridium tetanomorphum TaxID=1553 RepID=A0A923EAZ9_CLOTT|nr:ABC transporter ATP-binding protein [Clostridium tetanomorphum]KAJ48910.1 iron(III)-transport ATP-binding protein sfuC [Clostridium tetanomorphum DSM 665]KAJ52167.1 iron(III)-transport ATP-binding protein sfuC [Clostridium tetanomorphum DSM 665]MBC2399917.1 ABC transporter ATP-binding protein [Clostridium tetanomorphum]MBP1866436.1 iron(III) transport system ATP-binding protein [Clostridium tetanomorphum]NRS86762.1 iron(III) transport system ATP-binding protein [Clostridium tetanomorphum]
MSSKFVKLENITKIYKGNEGKTFTAVDNVSVKIEPGEFVTLLGPSGCGKTTTLRMIAGFEVPTSGDIYIGDEKVNSLTPDKRDTAMVFQTYALFPHLNTFENIAYGLKIKKLPSKDIGKSVQTILELVGLSGLENRAPNQLSGGQQQRVALARALVMQPSVLLFDEPLSNLDAKLRVHMRTEIRKIQKKIGITSVYVTHDQAEAMSMSDRVIIMNKGIIEQIGTPQEIYKNPASEFVADFIGVANIFDSFIEEIESEFVYINLFDKRFKVKTHKQFNKKDKVKVVIRPEALSFEEGNIEVGVKSSVFMGAYQDYNLKYGNIEIKLTDYNPLNKKVYSEGQTAFLNIDENSIHLIPVK